jgi:hypothetical protein
MSEKDVRKLALSVVRDYESVKKRRRKKPISFTQRMCNLAWVALFVFTQEYFVLYLIDKPMPSDVPLAIIAIVATVMQSLSVLQNIIRDTSLNKNLLYLDETTGVKTLIAAPNTNEAPAEGVE